MFEEKLNAMIGTLLSEIKELKNKDSSNEQSIAQNRIAIFKHSFNKDIMRKCGEFVKRCCYTSKRLSKKEDLK